MASPTDTTTASGVVLSAETLANLEAEKSVLKEVSELLDYNKEALEKLGTEEVKYNAAVNANIDSLAKRIVTLNEYKQATLDIVKQQGDLRGSIDAADRKLKEEIESLETMSSIMSTKLTNAIKEVTRLKAEEAKYAKDKAEHETKQKEFESKLRDLDNQHQDKNLDNMKKLIGSKKTLEELSKKEKKSLNAIIKATPGLTEVRDLILKINELKNNKPEIRDDIQQEIKYNEELIKRIPLEISATDTLKLKRKATDEVKDSISGLADKLGLGDSKSNLLTKSLMGMSGGFGNFISNIGVGLEKAFLSPEVAMNRLFNFLQKNLIESSLKFDENITSINKNLGGMGQEFEDIALKSEGGGLFKASAVGDLAKYGIGIKELGAAYGALSSKINGFNNMLESDRKILAANAASMETLGLSAQNYAGLVSTYMGSLNKTADGARIAIERLSKEAVAAGRGVTEYAKEFEQLLPKIIGFGREASQIFKELNALATMTKGVLTTGELSSFASQFDNWDSAAESVSKLNAALGGTSLNIEDLMRADPSEKLIMLKRAFDESGQDFDKLNIGFKRLLSESFGGDVNKAGAFFKGSLEEANAQMIKMAASEEELAKRKEKSIAAQQKLTKAIESMQIAMTPVIKLVGYIGDIIIGINDHIGAIPAFIVSTAAFIFLAIKPMMWMFAGSIKAAFSTVFAQLSAEITAIRTAISAPIVAPPVTGGAFAGKAGIAAAVIGVSAMVAGSYLSNKEEQKKLESQKATEIATKPQQNITPDLQNFTGMQTRIPTGESVDAEFSGRQLLFSQVPETGEKRPVANLNKNDKFKVEAATPSERAEEHNLKLSPFISFMKDFSRESYEKMFLKTNDIFSSFFQDMKVFTSKTDSVIAINDKLISQTQDRNSTLVRSSNDTELVKQEIRKEEFKNIIEKTVESAKPPTVNVNLGEMWTTLDKRTADEMNRRAVKEAVAVANAAPNRKDALAEDYSV